MISAAIDIVLSRIAQRGRYRPRTRCHHGPDDGARGPRRAQELSLRRFSGAGNHVEAEAK